MLMSFISLSYKKTYFFTIGFFDFIDNPHERIRAGAGMLYFMFTSFLFLFLGCEVRDTRRATRSKNLNFAQQVCDDVIEFERI